MADNTTLNAGTGGDTIATDDIGGVKYQRVKPSIGADGAASDAVPAANSLDSTGTGIQAVGIVAQFDDASTSTVTENQFAHPRISSRRALLVEGVASGTVVPVSDGAGSLTVDGTVTVQDGGGAISVDDNGSTISIDDGAGNISIDDGGNSITVDGSVTANAGTNLNTSLLALESGGNLASVVTSVQLIDDIVYTDDTSTHATGTSKGALMMAAATPTDSAVNANDIGAVAMTTDRKLHVSVQDALPAGTAAIGKLAANSGVDIGDVDVTSVPADPFGANADAASATGSISAKLRFIAGTGIPITGTVTVGSHAVTNSTLEALSRAEDAGHTTGDTGVMALAVRSAAPTDRSAGPTDGDYEPLAVNEVGAVWGTLTPSANGGCTTFMASGSDGSSILVATAQAIKASAGVLYGYYAYNPEAAVTFVHFYNTAAASVTVGTTNPLFTIAIPAGSAANLALPYGITFSNAGWSCAATTTAGGTGAPATGVSLVAWYK